MPSWTSSTWRRWASTAWCPRRRAGPATIPATLLKLYIYGYLNRVPSSRRLEREARRNVELMWLTGRLAPDFKTIADFRKDNGPAIQAACRAVRGAVPPARPARRRRSWRWTAASSRRSTPATRTSRPAQDQRRMEQVEASIARYLAALETADRQEERGRAKAKPTRLEERIAAPRASRCGGCSDMEAAVRAAPDRQVSLTDPDARAMATSGKGTGLVGYNVQAAVDTEAPPDRRARGDERRQRPRPARADGRAGAARRWAQEELTRAGGPRLLLGRGDPGLRAGRHHAAACPSR